MLKIKKGSRYVTATDRQIMEYAREAAARYYASAPVMANPAIVREYLLDTFIGMEREVFAVIFMDSQHKVLACENMFYGTIAEASVWPREIVKKSLAHNAAAIIVAHNHPSGDDNFSAGDISVTQRVKEACALIDVRVLDHILVAGTKTASMAERHLM